jgi:glycosyltransferase involved in cell wall biosynthesis
VTPAGMGPSAEDGPEPKRDLPGSLRSPLVSVIMPTRDRKELLSLSLRSVLWQRDVEFEVIVVDDGSTDGTSVAVGSVGDPRVRLYTHASSQGVSASRNHGIAEAKGAWIAFLDDDDLWAPDKLALQLRAATATGRDWVYAGSVNVDPSDRVRGGSPPIPPDRLLAILPRWNSMPGGCSNVLVRARALARVGGFDTGLHILADWEMWLRLAREGPPALVPRPLVGYRVHPMSMSLDPESILAELSVLEPRHGRSFDRARILRHFGRVNLRTGGRRAALPLLLRAVAAGGARELVTEVPRDAVLVMADIARAIRRRLGVGASGRESSRQRRLRSRDPNRAWKAEAESWVSELRRYPDGAGRPVA